MSDAAGEAEEMLRGPSASSELRAFTPKRILSWGIDGFVHALRAGRQQELSKIGIITA
jgi:hypothetical protein